MFTRQHGHDSVRGGTYLCLNTGEFHSVAPPAGRLPGPSEARYLRVSPLIALLVGPIVGMLFVIFLPLAVPLFVLYMVARRLGLRAPAFARHMADVVRQQQVWIEKE